VPKVTFLQKNGDIKEVNAAENWSIMQVAVEHGIDGIEGACGGAMACATCHCYIDPAWEARVAAQDNEKSEEEDDMLDLAFDVRDSSRLGCQVKLTEDLDGLMIALPGASLIGK